MLNRIRNLSTSPVILLMFGMLILVFVLFFGMPSMGGGAGQGVWLQTGATVFDQDLRLKDAHDQISRHYGGSKLKESARLALIKERFKMTQRETLLDVIIQRKMGWITSENAPPLFNRKLLNKR